ncbi:hypothetical protein L6452_31970 [Arctium lappa]|uniref:Uncharacterized protein n=1 Tax=Arctium lappa TaxID=4217 RepID=A0ACB8Z3W3_ARCLA|nr:hypothetical protein L6452_31970 [Arctium lappa]
MDYLGFDITDSSAFELIAGSNRLQIHRLFRCDLSAKRKKNNSKNDANPQIDTTTVDTISGSCLKSPNSAIPRRSYLRPISLSISCNARYFRFAYDNANGHIICHSTFY